jgi:hypothetical protein
MYRAGKVILEIGFRGGCTPNAVMSINSMIGELVVERGGVIPLDFNNFQMVVLAPERTFIEKLYAIEDGFRRGFIAQRTRHFYDVHRLMATTRIQQFLMSGELQLLSEAVRAKTEQYYGSQVAPTLSDLTCHGATKSAGYESNILAG